MPNFKNYIKVCETAAIDENVFANFKRIPEYVDILEHVSLDLGIFLYNYLKYNDKKLVEKDNLKKFSSKDLIGNPACLASIEDILISPTTLRYIKVLSDIKKIFPDLNEETKIVEIGVGYGGQSKIFFDYYNLKEYDCIDLPQTFDLTKKYMNEYPLSFYSSDNIPNKKWDLCVSNYAFSECPIEIQKIYLSKIIKNSKRGYFTMNFISEEAGVTSYSKEEFLESLSNLNAVVKIEDEFPKTHPRNCLVTWTLNE